jgi:hypothetical protein
MKNLALIYKYYYSKKLPQPYFRTIMTVIGFLVMIVSIFFSIFPLPLYFNPFGISKKKIVDYGYGIIFIAILYFIISTKVKKKYLEEYFFTEKQIKNCGRYIIILFCILFCILFGAIILQIRNKW